MEHGEESKTKRMRILKSTPKLMQPHLVCDLEITHAGLMAKLLRSYTYVFEIWDDLIAGDGAIYALSEDEYWDVIGAMPSFYHAGSLFGKDKNRTEEFRVAWNYRIPWLINAEDKAIFKEFIRSGDLIAVAKTVGMRPESTKHRIYQCIRRYLNTMIVDLCYNVINSNEDIYCRCHGNMGYDVGLGDGLGCCSIFKGYRTKLFNNIGIHPKSIRDIIHHYDDLMQRLPCDRIVGINWTLSRYIKGIESMRESYHTRDSLVIMEGDKIGIRSSSDNNKIFWLSNGYQPLA